MNSLTVGPTDQIRPVLETPKAQWMGHRVRTVVLFSTTVTAVVGSRALLRES